MFSVFPVLKTFHAQHTSRVQPAISTTTEHKTIELKHFCEQKKIVELFQSYGIRNVPAIVGWIPHFEHSAANLGWLRQFLELLENNIKFFSIAQEVFHGPEEQTLCLPFFSACVRVHLTTEDCGHVLTPVFPENLVQLSISKAVLKALRKRNHKSDFSCMWNPNMTHRPTAYRIDLYP